MNEITLGTITALASGSVQAKVLIDGSSTPVNCWTGSLAVSVGTRVVCLRVGKEAYALQRRSTS
jgi:molybdopterin-binding protein